MQEVQELMSNLQVAQGEVQATQSTKAVE